MAKMDLKSAFRQIPVHPSDWNLLGLTWQDQFYFEKVLPFGLRSAPFLFNQVGAAIEWIMRKHGAEFLIRYLDDFLCFGRAAECFKAKSIMLEVCQSLNVPVNPEKTVGPATRMEFLGIILDSDKMELSISSRRKQELLADLLTLSRRRTCTKRHLLQLIGKLSFACRVVPSGRIFLRRLIDKSTEVGPLHHHIYLNKDAKADMRWWLALLPSWSGTSTVIDPTWQLPPHFQLYTDAAGEAGFGAFWNGKWFNGKWGPESRQRSINWKELFVILLAAATWGHCWRGRSILFHCDNSAVVDIWNKGSTRQPHIMSLVRSLYFSAAQHEFHVAVQHIPGINNSIADALSRFQEKKFRHLAPHADTVPTPIRHPRSHSTQSAETYGIFSGLP